MDIMDCQSHQTRTMRCPSTSGLHSQSTVHTNFRERERKGTPRHDIKTARVALALKRLF